MDLESYRAEAEAFTLAIDREHYLHFSGQRETFDVEPIYERHAALFSHEAVEALRSGAPRELLELAAHGLIGRATAREAEELARREAALEVEAAGRRLPFRQAAIAQANEPDAGRRAELEAARLELTERELTPLLLEAHERARALTRELGWPSVLAMTEELSAIDLRALAGEPAAFLAATEPRYEALVGPQLEAQLGLGFGDGAAAPERRPALRRSDLPAFFRAPALDERFPAERRDAAFRATVAGLGIDLDALPNVRLDTEARPRKSPRAFCAPVRVPDEVYLVLAPTGGRDDYETLLHEAGHALHYGHVDPGLPFEHRHLGDNSVTEAFAFLLQGLAADPLWLERRLGIADPEPVVAFAQASKLVFLRRYCAKLAYELELHGDGAELGAMPARYSELLSRAVHVDWPPASWLADVDAFFYAARYLRAWALETHLRHRLRERFGELWFERPETGELLRGLWREGQRRPAEELLGEPAGAERDFSRLLEELGAAA